MFPYIKKIIVNDCYASQNFEIEISDDTSFRHLILTGKNGSGKTTILNRLAFLLAPICNINKGYAKLKGEINSLEIMISSDPYATNIEEKKEKLKKLTDLEIKCINNAYWPLYEERFSSIYTYFEVHRKVVLKNVETVTKEYEFIQKLKKNTSLQTFSNQFKQYLVNKKIYQAFDYMESNGNQLKQIDHFFNELTDILRKIFHDPKLELLFEKENFEFFIKLSDGQRITFNQLSEGFSAFITIIADLLMRTDTIRKIKKDYSYNPCGIILIDEPETHCHLAMQYEILPFINTLFPNLQLIAATHSPAVISSLKNAVVFDLSSKQRITDWVLSSSFSELMVKHFGLENEFSNIADQFSPVGD